MKTLYSLIMILMASTLVIAQNQSNGILINSILNPTGPQFTGVPPQPPLPFAPEIFRFQPGLVTQADDFADPDDPFSFFDARWFSIGRLQTSEQQTLYGLRFQLPFRAVTFGYQDIEDRNPRIQWIYEDEGIGDLEFRVANNFTSTNSDLVATMRSDTGTVFGLDNAAIFDDAKLGILDKNFDKALLVINEANNHNQTYGIEVLNQSDGPENYGVSTLVNGLADQNFGFNAFVAGQSGTRSWGLNSVVDGSSSIKFGVQARSIGPGDTNFGVFGEASEANRNFGIYGRVLTDANGDSLNPGDFAGFFEGDVEVTGMFTSSDRKLKTNIENVEDGLEKVMSLKPKLYEFIKTNKKVLPQGQQYGFIAQELEEFFPELIKNVKKPVFDKEGNITEYFEYKSVNYIPLIAVLTASVQELTKEVENLKATNNS